MSRSNRRDDIVFFAQRIDDIDWEFRVIGQDSRDVTLFFKPVMSESEFISSEFFASIDSSKINSADNVENWSRF